MKDSTTISCVRALINLISTFGTPSEITLDRGRQFISRLWEKLITFIVVQPNKTTSFHLQCNGIVERFHRQLKASLKAKLTDTNWTDELPLILLGIRASSKDDTSCSSAEMVFGTNLRLPCEFFELTSNNMQTEEFVSRLRETVNKMKPTQTSYHGNINKNRLPSSLTTAKYVFVRHDAHRTPLLKVYDGPYKVVKNNNDTYFTILINNRIDNISTDRLKPSYLLDDFQPATIARRGRPKRMAPN